MAGNLSSNNYNRGGRRRRSFRPTSDINVTPLVDVMLVLLIIFMVTAPMLTVGVPVDLPKTQAAQMNDQVDPLVVSIDINGQTYFQEIALPLGEILEKLKVSSEGKPDTKIYVRGDKKLPYGQIMETMGAIAAAGFSRVSLIAELPTPTVNKNIKENVSSVQVHKAPSTPSKSPIIPRKSEPAPRNVVPPVVKTMPTTSAQTAQKTITSDKLKQTR